MIAKTSTECKVVTTNETGTGARVAECVSSAGVNLAAFCGYGGGDHAEFMLVADDIEQARTSLKNAGYEPTFNEVVVVEAPNQAGALAEILKTVARAGIVLDYAYATATGTGQALCILRAADPAKTVAALRAAKTFATA